MRVVFAGVLYFATVFVVAFVLGTVRTLWLEPALGETWAVACEAPFLLLTMYLSVKHVVPLAQPPLTKGALVGIGLIALVLQVGADFALVFAMGEVKAAMETSFRTPADLIYRALLAVYAAMPWLLLYKR